MDDPYSTSSLKNLALKTPDWSVDARALSVAPLLTIALVAVFTEPGLAVLLLAMLLSLVFALSIEPISGLLLIVLGPAVAWLLFGSAGAIVSGGFLVLLGLLGLFWTLRSIRFEMRRADRVAER